MKRCAIVGTASSWKQTPWADAGLTVIGLNDAYALSLPRADEWYDLHPLTKMWFRAPKQRHVLEKDVPPGHYIRPEGHLEWLKTQAQTIPVWLQDAPPADWPANAHRLPIEQLEAKYGTYWASGPAYELLHLYDRGYREFQIFGIHLSTEHEYREQRPNFEFILGRLLGPEYTTTVDGRVRIYQGKETRVILPVESPILQHAWKYGYEVKPVAPPNPYRDELARTRKQKAALVTALVQWPANQDKAKALAELEELEIIEIDCADMLRRSHGSGTLTAQLAGVGG